MQSWKAGLSSTCMFVSWLMPEALIIVEPLVSNLYGCHLQLDSAYQSLAGDFLPVGLCHKPALLLLGVKLN
jgi:hypothetical protein